MIHEVIDIYTSDSQAKLSTYMLDNFPRIDSNRKRPAVIICPGGGYEFTSDRDGEPVAIRLNAMGFHACVLRYSVRPATFPSALMELASAVKLVREHAEEWHVDEDKIIILGFSAGGHLAASLGVFWDKAWLADAMGVANEKLKPNGLLLSYPVITSGVHAHRGSFEALLGENPETSLEDVSLEKHVTAGTPPTFLWHTYEDLVVPVENAFLFASALREYNIPLEMHIYPRGRHGLSLANEETYSTPEAFGIQKECQNWIELAGVWLKNL